MKSAVGETGHAIDVGIGAREQGGAARGAGRACAEGLAKEDTLLGKALQVRSRDSEAVGLNVAAGVV